MSDTGRYYLLSPARYLKLNLPVPHDLMLAEALALRDQFTSYRTDQDVYRGWHSLTLHGLAYDKGYSWENYPDYIDANHASDAMSWTEIAENCPVTVNWLKTVFPSNRYGRVRFLLLEAGGSIGLHNDTDVQMLEMVNVALSHPKDCHWYWEDDSEVPFAPGDAYAVNISYPHRVVNNSTEDRYHLIVHHHDSTAKWMHMMGNALKEHNEQGRFVYSQELY